MKRDIETREDIERLVNLFYEKVVSDTMLRDFFGEVVPIDWEMHLPRMVGFWEFIIWGTPGAYTGNMTNPHVHVHQRKPMLPEHFARWVQLFQQTVDELFEGVRAEELKQAAYHISLTLKYKIAGGTGNSVSVKQVDDSDSV